MSHQRRFVPEEDLEESLKLKASRVKEIAINLGNEIRVSNKLVNGLDDDFEKSTGYMEATIKRVFKLSKSGNWKLYFYLILFCLFVFLVLYVLIKWF